MGLTQDALYADLDLDLSWSERALPERERTKHVHRLHPYHGKFIPQLVEALLSQYVPRGRVLDPFAGSGTTLVQALESRLDATGVELAAFNCLLIRVKVANYNLFALERELRDVLTRLEPDRAETDNAYLRTWYAPQALSELLHFRSLIPEYEHGDVLRVILSRAARSARRTTHFDLEAPRTPQLEPYWCHKHRRECRPVESARRSSPATRSTRSHGSRSSRTSVLVRAQRRCCTATHRRSTTARASRGSSPRRRIRG
jgi:hypothetical protein